MTSGSPTGVVQLGPYPPPYGGVAANMLAIDKRLVELGVPTHTVSVGGARGGDAPRVAFPSGSAGILTAVAKSSQRVVHMHVGGELSSKDLSMVMACTLLPGRCTVLTLHSGGFVATDRRPGRASYAGLVFRRVDRVVGVNAQMLEWFGELGCDPARVRLIEPHAIDEGYLTEAARPLEGALAAFRAAHDTLLVTVGGLAPEYDVATQLDALAALRESIPGAGLIVVGSGPEEAALKARVAELHLGDHVLIAGGLPGTDTARLMAQADVFLRTTLYDGDSIAVREALHLGTPVVTTDNGMRPDGVRLVPIGDASAVAGAVAEWVAEGRPRSQPKPPDRGNVETVVDLYRSLATLDTSVAGQKLAGASTPGSA